MNANTNMMVLLTALLASANAMGDWEYVGKAANDSDVYYQTPVDTFAAKPELRGVWVKASSMPRDALKLSINCASGKLMATELAEFDGGGKLIGTTPWKGAMLSIEGGTPFAMVRDAVCASNAAHDSFDTLYREMKDCMVFSAKTLINSGAGDAESIKKFMVYKCGGGVNRYYMETGRGSDAAANGLFYAATTIFSRIAYEKIIHETPQGQW